MIDKTDLIFLEELCQKEKNEPSHKHFLISYESDFLNVSDVFEINKNNELMIKNKECMKHLQKWREKSTYVRRLFSALTSQQLSQQIQKEHIRNWVGCYVGTNYITLQTEDQFKPDEKVTVFLEQLNVIDFEYDITFRKSITHNHDFFEIIYVFKGSCTTTISGVLKTLYEGDICIYNLQAVHQLGIYDENSVVFNVLMRKSLFNDTFLQLIKQNNTLASFFINSIFCIANPEQHLIFHRNEQNDCELYICKIISEYYKDQIMSQNMMKSLLVLFFTSLSRSYQNIIAQSHSSNKKNELVNIVQVISYISEHAHTITLKKFGEHFHYTPRTMMRFIQKYTHRKFSDIVREFRLKNACDLLEQTNLPIREIAKKIGYCERSYFDKLFKSCYELTPVEYRNRILKTSRN